jgi:hypothetical protein
VTYNGLNKFYEKIKRTVSLSTVYSAAQKHTRLDKSSHNRKSTNYLSGVHKLNRRINFFPLLSFGRFLILVLAPTMLGNLLSLIRLYTDIIKVTAV